MSHTEYVSLIATTQTMFEAYYKLIMKVLQAHQKTNLLGFINY
jgi:hypothetical protein